MTSDDLVLISQYHTTHNAVLREELIVRYLPLVRYTLGRLGVSQDIGNDFEDLISQGILGLIDAVDRFDPQHGTQFSTYATIKVRGKILDYMRSLDWLSRTARHRSRLVSEGIQIFWVKNQRIPTDEELATSLNLGVSQVKTALADSSRVLVSLDSLDETEDGDDVSLHEVLADPYQVNPADLLDEEETKTNLISSIKALPEREKVLLSLYYYEGLTFKEIGEVMEISESRVCQLHARAVLSLKTMMA